MNKIFGIFGAFQPIEQTVEVSGDFETVRNRLNADTEFQEKLPTHWDMALKEKQFAGVLQRSGFLIMQKPSAGTRFGPMVSGRWIGKSPGDGVVQVRAWINPRARGKIIFGYLLAVGLIATLLHDYYTTGTISEFNRILPYALLAVLPMNFLASISYVKTRNRAMEHISALLKGLPYTVT